VLDRDAGVAEDRGAARQPAALAGQLGVATVEDDPPDASGVDDQAGAGRARLVGDIERVLVAVPVGGEERVDLGVDEAAVSLVEALPLVGLAGGPAVVADADDAMPGVEQTGADLDLGVRAAGRPQASGGDAEIVEGWAVDASLLSRGSAEDRRVRLGPTRWDSSPLLRRLSHACQDRETPWDAWG